MPEFRWILLGLGMLLLGGIWWWGSRRPAQARGFSELRESDSLSTLTSLPAAEPGMPANAAAPAAFSANPVMREPSISPYEPLRISTQDCDDAWNSLDIPVMAELEIEPHGVELEDVQLLNETTPDPSGTTTTLLPPEPSPIPLDSHAQTHASTRPHVDSNLQTLSNSGRFARPRENPPAAPRTDVSGRFSRVKPETPKPIELQKILTLRVCAVADTSWAGEDLALALSGSDLVHGRYGVFHRLHADGRSVFCVASLVEPGSFDPARMTQQRFPGVSLFAVLPGPLEPLATLEALLEATRQLAQDLSGMMQDEQGHPLSPQRAGALREDVIDFQQRLQDNAAR